MKKWTALFLTLILVITPVLSGCEEEPLPSEHMLSFYYPRADACYVNPDSDYSSSDGLIGVELRDTSQSQNNIEFLINLYLKGPKDPKFINPFPDNTTVISYRIVGSNMTLILSPEFSKLTGADLTLASACLTRSLLTFFKPDGVTNVRLSSVSSMASPDAGRQWMDFNDGNLLMEDDSVARLRNSLLLYLTDDDYRNLVKVPVTVNLTSGNSTCNELINLLLVPGVKNLYSAVPDGTASLGATVNDGICTVNLSQEFLDHLYSEASSQYLALQSITNTFSQLSYIHGVNFYCEGTRLTHYGALDTSSPWVQDERCVLPEHTVPGGFYVSVCLPTELNDDLIPLSLYLTPSESATPAEQLLNLLVDYETCNGFRNPIPRGTAVLHVENNGGVYTIHLSEKFLSDPDSLDIAARCIVASMFSLSGVKSVHIVVDSPKAASYGTVFSSTVPSADWYA